MITHISRLKSAPKNFAALDQALKSFEQLSDRTTEERVAHALDLDAPGAELPPALAKHIDKALHTRSQGIPDEFDSAWAWASDWVKKNGVTLPPDTSYYRGLRNWFCFQVSMYKKKKLSDKSKDLLARYNIDLSLYRADNTGRGHRMNDDLFIQTLRQHHTTHGTYDLNCDSNPNLLKWQTRLLDSYRAGGTSSRMRNIALQLPGFSYGQWLRPGDPPVPSNQFSWWARAADFRAATHDCPAFRGRIDPATPTHLREWASEQIGLTGRKLLTPRQRGELMSLNLIARAEHRISQAKALALAKARGTDNVTQFFGKRERDLQTFLGATLLAHFLRNNTELTTIYSTLSIAPAQFSRARTALAPLMVEIVSLSTKVNLNRLRKVYRTFHEEFEAVKNACELPAAAFAELRPKEAKRIERLAAVILGLRDTMRRINIRQDLAREDVAQMH
jgi:hypothetical protein